MSAPRVYEGRSLGEAMDVLVHDFPTYRWLDWDEFVDFGPVSGAGPVLGTLVKRFDLDAMDGGQALSAVRRIGKGILGL